MLAARDPDNRAQRLTTLTRVREHTAGRPPTIASPRRTRAWRPPSLPAGRKPRVHDTWIAATALVHGAQVWTQDADSTSFAAVDVVRV